MDRAPDPRVGAATAEVAADGGVDVGIGRARLARQQLRRRHQHPRLAVAALRDLLRDPGLLQRMAPVGREPFDGRDALALDALDRSGVSASTSTERAWPFTMRVIAIGPSPGARLCPNPRRLRPDRRRRQCFKDPNPGHGAGGPPDPRASAASEDVAHAAGVARELDEALTRDRARPGGPRHRDRALPIDEGRPHLLGPKPRLDDEVEALARYAQPPARGIDGARLRAGPAGGDHPGRPPA